MLKRTGILIKRKYMEFFVPTVLTAMANSIAMLVDSTIVNLTLGTDAFAAVNLMSPIIQLYVAISILFGMSAATLIAKFKGEDGTDINKSGAAFTTSVIMLLLTSILIMVLQFAFIDNISGLLTKDKNILSLLKLYYIPMIAGTPITLMMTSGVYIIRTEGRPRFASFIIIVSNAVNLVLDLVLILVFKLGVIGASIATVAGNSIGLLMFLSHFKRIDNTLHFSFRMISDGKAFFNNVKELLAYGVSGCTGALLITIKMFFLNSIVQKYGGAKALVAFSVVSLCQIFDSAFVAGACQTMVPISSMLFGEKDYYGIKTVFMQAFKILMISTLTIMILMEIFASSIALAYNMTDYESLKIGTEAIRICALMFPADAIVFLWLYYYISLGKNKISTSISFLNGVGFIIPLGIILPKIMGLSGVWTALALSQYFALLYVIITAIIINKKENRKTTDFFGCSESREIFAFSLNNEDWSDKMFDELKITVACKNGAESPNSSFDDAYMMELSKCLYTINSASLEKRRRSKNTDVRICKDMIIIKNSGADVKEDDFGNAIFSKTLGFNHVVIQ